MSKRVLCGYLHNLKALFSIGIKNGKYYITYLHSKFEKKNNTKTEESYSWEQLIKKECHRRHIDYTDQAAADTAGLVGQYRKLAGSTERAITQVIRGIARSVDGIKNKERQLNAKYVHHIIKEFLSVPDSGTKETDISHSKNRFNNFHQRNYDYSELEKVLLTTEI